MKYQAFILLLLSLTISVVQGQNLSKDEKKRLKKEIKELQKNPAAYKEFKDGIQKKKEQAAQLDNQIDELNASVQGVEQQIRIKDQEIKKLGDEIIRLKSEKDEIQTVSDGQTNLDGLVYKVQVEIPNEAIYREINLEGIEKEIFTGEVDPDGTRNYTIGYFRDRGEAQTFKDYLHLLRITKAKVVAYRDGQKVIE